jgi:hypothetical protein
MAASGRELLLPAQGIPPHRNSLRKTDACFAGVINLVAAFLASQ